MQMVELSTVAELLRNGASIKQSDSASGTPITRIETIADWNINPDRCGYADVSVDDFPNHILQNGDILISHINSTKHLGKCALYKGVPEKLIHGMNLLGLRVKSDVAYSDYIYRVLCSQEFRRQLPTITKDSVNQSSFTVTNFKALKIPLPHLNEQKRIAVILDKADAIRRKRQQAIDLTEQLLRSVFLDMFGDPVTNPKGIEIAPMTDVFDITTGKLNSNAAVEGGEYPFFTCAKQAFEIDSYAFDQEALLLAGNNAQAEYDVKHYIGKFNAYQRTYVLTLKDESWSYPFYQFALEYQLENLKRFSKGTNTKYITMEIMGRTMLPMPHPKEQLEFVRRVETARSLTSVYKKYSMLADESFQSLTQQAFSGELSKQAKAA